MAFVKHPTLDGDGVVCVAGQDGKTLRLAVVDGVLDWPDHIPLHNSYRPAEPSKRLLEAKRQQAVAELKAQAAELGVRVEEREGTDGESAAGDAGSPDAPQAVSAPSSPHGQRRRSSSSR